MRLLLYIQRSPLQVLLGLVALLCLIPVVEVAWVLGTITPAFTPAFGDEGFYYAHVQTIAEGQYNDGNPYFFEHRADAPLVIFGGAWLNALPLLAGLPFNAAMLLNFILWALAFAAAGYLLYREFAVPRWLAVAGVLGLFLQCYFHIFRPANLQPVYPFFLLFYWALARLLREQSRTNILLLAGTIGATFYLYSYLWQAVVVTLGLLVLYALVRRQWPLFKATLLASTIGGMFGLPSVAYTFWLSHTSPYFWESLSRFGLVYTRIPMAEIVYSGGWVGVVLALLGLLYWCVPALRTGEFRRLCLFVVVSGLGLWITQGSNALTGILVETGEHVRILILPWLLFVTVMIGAHLWRQRAVLEGWPRAVAVAGVGVVALASVYYTYAYFAPFVEVTEQRREQWVEEQHYAKPLQWLQEHEQAPVVVWSDPRDEITASLPIYTRHFTLYTPIGMWHLVPEEELHERYLVSQYFDPPTVETLQLDMPMYLGRQYVFHRPKTIERRIKVCKLLHVFDRTHDCGAVPTSVELKGEAFFAALAQNFQNDIKPNIEEYLNKYHVSYILKDVVRNAHWHLEKLGGTKIYSDGKYELYRLSL